MSFTKESIAAMMRRADMCDVCGKTPRVLIRGGLGLCVECMRKHMHSEILTHILDKLSEYHPDVAPADDDSTADLLDKYFYWVSEYNDGTRSVLEREYSQEFIAWVSEKEDQYNG